MTLRFKRLISLCLIAVILIVGTVGCTLSNDDNSNLSSSSKEQYSSDTTASNETTSDESSSELVSSEGENSQNTTQTESQTKPESKPEQKPVTQTVLRDKLPLITPDGDDMAYHPSVVKFDTYWNGYKYWIAFTPYPNSDATKENPVINVSNNLTEWQVPNGLKNPLDVPNPSDAHHYNSDTHMIYNPDEDRLELFWRYVCDDGGKIGSVTIFRSVSYDGVNWEPKTTFLFLDDRRKYDYVSPSIILENGVYRMWYVDVDKKAYYAEIKDGVIGESVLMNIPFKGKLVPWHIDVIYNKEKNLYEMVACAYTTKSDRQTMSLYYTSSQDNVNWSVPRVILRPSSEKNRWDSRGLYRACLLYDANKYFVFFSAHGPNKANIGVGLVYGSDIFSLKPYN